MSREAFCGKLKQEGLRDSRDSYPATYATYILYLGDGRPDRVDLISESWYSSFGKEVVEKRRSAVMKFSRVH